MRKILGFSGIVWLLVLSATPAGADNTIFTCHQAGTGPHWLKACISRAGNMLHFEFPAGEDQLFHEGYAVCYNFPNQPNKVAYDSGFGSGGWGPATINQPGGVNTFPLTITRTTTDGALRLQQKFTWESADKHGILIEMKLTNTSGQTLNFQALSRYFNANFHPHPPFLDIFDRTDLSVNARDGHLNGEGMELSRLTDNGSTAIHSFANWQMNACVQSSVPSPTAGGDWVGRVTVPGYSMSAGRTETIKVVYRRQ